MRQLLELVYKLLELIGPDYTAGKVVGILVSLVGAVEFFRRIGPVIKTRTNIVLRRWRITQLDEVAQRLVESERKYLGAFLEVVRTRNWDPKRFVRPDLSVREKTFEPIDPILLLVDTVAGRENAELSIHERKEKFRSHRVRDTLTALKAMQGLMILGDPGSGKTTCLLQLGTEIANRGLLSASLRPALPLFLPLNEFTAPIPESNAHEAVLLFVRNQIKGQSSAFEGSDISKRLEQLIRDGRLVFLFDALDEMPRDGYYERFRALSKFTKFCSTSNPQNLFVFTCRKLDYVDDPTFPAHQAYLSPFSNAQVRQFFKRYLGATETAQVTNNHLVPDLELEMHSPFFLSLITASIQAKTAPGSTWNVLIRNFVQIAFDNERIRRGYDQAEWKPILTSVMEWLSILAFELVRSRATGTKADAGLVKESLIQAGLDEDALDLACSCRILRRIGAEGDVRFEHHRLQEYFAAQNLAIMFDAQEADPYEFIDDIWWREVVLMTSGIMTNPDALIDGILDAADEVEFTRFSEIETDFSRVMTAMACYRPARHILSHNTQRRLTEYLIQFLKLGNILQKVRSLRVAAQFGNDPRVINEIKRLLRDSSGWVRETAFSVLAEHSATRGGSRGAIHREMFSMTKGEEMLLNGLTEIPALLRFKSTRWLVPLYCVYAILGIIRAAGVWFIVAAVTMWEVRQAHLDLSNAIIPIAVPIATYWGAKHFVIRRLHGTYRWNLTSSFNRWTLFLVTLNIIFVAIATGLNFAGNRGGRVGDIGANLVGLLIVYVLAYFAIGGWTRIYLAWRDQRRSRWFDFAGLTPAPSVEGRLLQAERILHAANDEKDPIVRAQLVDLIKTLLPLNASILDSLEDFCESELDVKVRTRAYQVYEQVELSINRERGKGRGERRNAAADD